MDIAIKLLDACDEAILQSTVPGLFDDELDAARAVEFLRDERHHLVVALENGAVVGFASAVHYVHPDKTAPELWINEVGVIESYQRQGIGRRMMLRLFERARELGCQEAWLLTERDNTAAIRLYTSVGGSEFQPDPVMFTFDLDQDREPHS